MYHCTNLVNRQNQLPVDLMDAGEYCLPVMWVTQPYSSTPWPAAPIRATLQQQEHPLHPQNLPACMVMTSTDGCSREPASLQVGSGMLIPGHVAAA